MSRRTIEETFQAIKPRGRKGIPNPPAIGVGVTSDTGDLTSSLSQAGQQISQLQAAYQQQAALISANTQAVQGNTSAQSGRSDGSVAGGLASSFGGALGLLSPLISGIASLFGGSSSPAPLPLYTPPPSVAISASLNSAVPALPASGNSAAIPASTAGNATSAGQPAGLQQVTVNVNAMDSQSFMDRSTDIASAVREAMLNMHPINDVVSSL
ncbi:MAG TPA: hypothetical protein VG273_21645 [Bryobacteraceae bacterium]|jgi:hypothetical protein|nr:hypothetical protein [Bryobacteraceae bacterium]